VGRSEQKKFKVASNQYKRSTSYGCKDTRIDLKILDLTYSAFRNHVSNTQCNNNHELDTEFFFSLFRVKVGVV